VFLTDDAFSGDDGEAWALVDNALDWVGSAMVSATKPGPPTADPSWQRYVGRYRNVGGDVQIIVRGGELTVIGPAAPDPLLTPSTLKPVGEHTFRVETKDGYGPGRIADGILRPRARSAFDEEGQEGARAIWHGRRVASGSDLVPLT
jgi:hypothetical protein